jgi:integrase
MELTNLLTDNVTFMAHQIVVTLCDTKNKTNRTFVINNEQWLLVIRKYYELRPPNTTHKRFFLFYGNNKCSRQPVGVNTFGTMPRKIAEFLQLPNPQSYTGHSFRRSSATLLAGKGVNFLGIKRLGGWKSSAVAEGYIEDSLHEKIAIADQLAAGSSSRSSLHNPLPSTSKCTWERPRCSRQLKN